VAWQSAAAVGIATGIAAGVALSRWLWILFAQQIYAIPQPTVPTLSLVYVGLGALVLANLVAAIHGRHTSRTPAALVVTDILGTRSRQQRSLPGHVGSHGADGHGQAALAYL
jgi:hypothetical protein